MSSLYVMIVEDEPLIGAAMQMLVEDEGGVALGPYMTLSDGLAAAESVERIDVALLDCNLGKEVSWQIADRLAARNVPFAFTSGKGIKDIDARFAGRPVFAKPVDENRLKRFLRQNARD